VIEQSFTALDAWDAKTIADLMDAVRAYAHIKSIPISLQNW